MLAHQAAYIEHLLDVVEQESVDLVMLSGDVYDRALPPVDAVRLAGEAFARLADSRASVVITSGNHDSAQRLGFGSELIDRAGVFIRTKASGVGRPVLLDHAEGPVAIYGLPYLDPDQVREPWGLKVRSHEATLAEAMRRVQSDLAGRRAQQAGLRSVVMAHAFVAGTGPVRESESERDISVGGISIAPASIFDGIDYTALGHLHGAQTVTDRVRYSGSPLAYSFSESDQVKGSWLVDLARPSEATFIPAPVPRPLTRLRGELAELLVDPRHTAAEQHWVEVTLTDPTRPRLPMEQIQQRFPHALVLTWQPEIAPTRFVASAPVPGRSDHALSLDFVSEMRGRPASAEEAALLELACDSCVPDRDLDREVV